MGHGSRPLLSLGVRGKFAGSCVVSGSSLGYMRRNLAFAPRMTLDNWFIFSSGPLAARLQGPRRPEYQVEQDLVAGHK